MIMGIALYYIFIVGGTGFTIVSIIVILGLAYARNPTHVDNIVNKLLK